MRRASGSWLFVLLLFAFGFFGLFWGAFAVLLADLSGALDLSPGPLGFALFVGAAASILAMAPRVGRRPVGTATVPGSVGERVRGWHRRAGAYQELRDPAGGPGYPLRRLRALRRGDKRCRRGPGEEHRPPVHDLTPRCVQRRWGDRSALRGRLAVGRHGLSIRLSRGVDSAGGGDPGGDADRISPSVESKGGEEIERSRLGTYLYFSSPRSLL